MSEVQKIELFDNLVKYAGSIGGKVKYKNESIFWTLMPNRLKRNALIIGKTIWLPNRDTRIIPLIHEISHLVDIVNTGRIKWYFDYLLPQSASILWFSLALLMYLISVTPVPAIIIGIAWILSPLPSNERAEREYRAYTVSTYFLKKIHGELTKEYKTSLIKNLSGWLYYKMIWRRAVAECIFQSIERRIERYDQLIKKYPEIKDIEDIIDA